MNEELSKRLEVLTVCIEALARATGNQVALADELKQLAADKPDLSLEATALQRRLMVGAPSVMNLPGMF